MKNIIEGVYLFNNAEFFAAHDFFEDLWMESENNNKLFFQGLTQVSVGCFHLISGNYKGTLSQLQKGIHKLSKYPPVYLGINIKNLIDDNNLLIEKIKLKKENFSVNLSTLPLIKTEK